MSIVMLPSAGIALMVALSVLVANPRRAANRALALFFGLITLWLLCLTIGFHAMRNERAIYRLSPLAWLQLNTLLTAWLPFLMWNLQHSIGGHACGKAGTWLRAAPWLGVAAALSTLTFFDSMFIRESPTIYERGNAYFAYIVVELVAYIVLLVQACREWRRQVGMRRFEFQFLALTMGSVCIIGVVLNGLGSYLRITEIKGATFPFILLSFAIAAWGITTHQILDAKQVIQRAARLLGVLALLVVLAFLGHYLLEDRVHAPFDFVLAIAIAGGIVLWLDPQTRDWFGIGDESERDALRRAVIAASRTEPHLERLMSTFESLLRERCGASTVELLFDAGAAHASRRIELKKSSRAHSLLCEFGWATPEALLRRRTVPGQTELGEFLDQHALALILTVPQGSPAPSLLLALGPKSNQRPFTYPEIRRLQQIGELIDNILTRARLTAQAALRARMEHVSLMSRGLAHDLKNLITPVSSFLIHTDGRYPAGSDEAEVHAAARRSVKIMAEYVREALAFSERLQPRFERVEVPKLLAAIHDATLARQQRREVSLQVDDRFGGALVADGVLLQRLFANLIHNAIDASSAGQAVHLSVGLGAGQRLRFTLADSGSGISADHLARVFEPYFTTKEFGDEVRGFGLGLTICQKIAHLHEGAISIQSIQGVGTTVTVELPLEPSSVRDSIAAAEPAASP